MTLPAVLYFAAFAAFAVFLAIYWTRTRWEIRPEGWHLSAVVLVMMANCALAVSVILWGAYPGVQLVRLVAATLVLIVAVGMVVSLVAVQRRGRHGARATLGPDDRDLPPLRGTDPSSGGG